MMPNMPYEKETVKLRTGDILLMFTDGVTEAKDPRDREYEEFRLEKLLRQSVDKGIETILDYTINAIVDFAAGAPQADDITILGMKITN
jgi:sigma-B regulation protein RsbU (phosphoserine phosphatase)